MPICTCPCPIHAQDGTYKFDAEAFWASVTGGSPKFDNSPARLVFMGDGRVGTSSLIKRFTRGVFETHYKPEVAKVMRHTKDVYTTRYNSNVTVQFWDIEGSDLRTSLLCAQKAHAVAVVYEVTNRSSFEFAQHLLEGINPRASVLLIASKIDQKIHRKVSYQEGRLLAKIHRVHYLETSAKLNEKIDEAFSIMVNSVPEEYLRSGSRESSSMSAVRRWQVTTAALCVACKAKLPETAKPDTETDKRKSKVKARSASEDHALRRPGSLRRRVRSEPEYDRSLDEKGISI